MKLYLLRYNSAIQKIGRFSEKGSDLRFQLGRRNKEEHPRCVGRFAKKLVDAVAFWKRAVKFNELTIDS